MKNILILALVGLSLTACTTDLAPDNLQGSWQLTGVKDFTVDIANAGNVLKRLCQPNQSVDLGVAGFGLMNFEGNRSGYNGNTYIRMGDRANNSTPNTDLSSVSYYIDCNDIIVSSIEHRDIYITGQPGHISKVIENGICKLKSDSTPMSRPKYTVFLKLGGSGQIKNSSGAFVDDEQNRYGQITYDCDDDRLTVVSRTAKPNGKASASGVSAASSLVEQVKFLKENRTLFKVTGEEPAEK
jgi:hypothetical protein